MTHGLGRKMRLGLCTAVAILALSFMAPATAEETFEERYARFQLFANCTPMDLYVSVSSEAEEIGLKATSVRAAAESRLRSARLYDSEMSFHLSVTANVVGAAFSAKLEYSKYFTDAVSGTFGYLLIRDTPPVGMYVLNMFRMRGSRLWGSRLHRACVV